MKIKFTDTRIAALPPPPAGKKDTLVFDAETPHLAVRVTTKSKHFLFQGRLEDGRQYRKTLGKFPALTTDRARKAVEILAGKMAAGVDLRAETAKRAAERDQRAQDAALTLGSLIDQWEEAATKAKRRVRYVKGLADGLRRSHAKLIDRPAASITPDELEAVSGSLADLPTAARAAGERSRVLYGWAIKTRKLTDDPTQRMVLPAKPGKRQTFLTGDEARAVWRAAGTMPQPYGTLIGILEATAVRLREAAEARWSEFSADLSEWTIPAPRMKAGEPHVVWLPPTLRTMLAALPRFQGSDFVFSADGRRAVTGFTALKARLDQALAGSGVRQFVFHDFRRTATTWLVRTGTDSIVADRLLAHTGLAKISGTASVYNVFDYEPQRREALERWVAFLNEEASATGITTGMPHAAPPSTVTPPPAMTDAMSMAITTGLAGVKAQTEVQLAALEEGFIDSILRIASRMDVIRVNARIVKQSERSFSRKFLTTIASTSSAHETAIAVLIHTAALAHMGGITVFKQSEVEAQRAKWSDQAKRWRDEAAKARAAKDLTKAEKAEGVAAVWEAALDNTMGPKDVCVVAYNRGDPASKQARAHGVHRMLLLLTETIFVAPDLEAAAVYATAATGVPMSRWRGRQPQRDGKIGARSSTKAKDEGTGRSP